MKIEGIITAMITPFNEEGMIDYEATSKHIDFLIEKGVHGLFILGTNGEFHVLSETEKLTFVQHVVNYTNHRVPVYAGTGSCSTAEAVHLAKQFEQLGVDALSVITPYLVKLSQKEIEKYYESIAKAVSIPLILYNIPVNTGMNIDAQTLKNLLVHENIKAIKDSSGNLDNLQSYLDVSHGHDFNVLVGSDSKIVEGLKRGAKGAVASTSNAIPEHIVSIYQSFKSGDLEKANLLQKEVDYLRDVTKHATIPAMIKRCVSVRHTPVGEAREPVAPVGSMYDQEIIEMFKKFKINL